VIDQSTSEQFLVGHGPNLTTPASSGAGRVTDAHESRSGILEAAAGRGRDPTCVLDEPAPAGTSFELGR